MAKPSPESLITFMRLTDREAAEQAAVRTRTALLTKLGLYYVPANETSERRMRGQGYKEAVVA